jgi:hypothetical protein
LTDTAKREEFGGALMEKTCLAMFIALTLLSNCKNTNAPVECPPCVSPAFEICLVDSADIKKNGFTLQIINGKNETLTVCDTSESGNRLEPDTVYRIYESSVTGNVFKIEITNPEYRPIEIENVTVTEGRCGKNTRKLTVLAEKNGLNKKTARTNTVLLDTVLAGCGNK